MFNIFKFIFPGEDIFGRVLIIGNGEASVKSMNILELLSVLIYFSSEIFRSFSFGKLILKLRISGHDGSPAGLSLRLKRYITKNISYLTGLIVFITPYTSIVGIISIALGLIMFIGFFMVFGEEKLALHDYLTGSSVCRRS
jgi:uncharacterized RDD family membrane protein YckC